MVISMVNSDSTTPLHQWQDLCRYYEKAQPPTYQSGCDNFIAPLYCLNLLPDLFSDRTNLFATRHAQQDSPRQSV